MVDSADRVTVVDVEPGDQLGLDGLDEGFELPPPLARVTPARLATWESCPRRYRLTYLDRPAPPRGGPRADSTMGAVIHLALRALFRRPLRERTPAVAAGLVDRNWSDEGFRDAEQAAEYRRRARGWVADYVEQLDPNTETVGIERWVSASTPRMVIEGRVDRIDERDGELVIVDYKTGRRAPTTEDARDSRALALYAHATAQTLRRPCWRVELHHLPTGTVLAWEHDRDSLRQHLDRAETAAVAATEAADSLAHGGDPDALFPPAISPSCAFCDMRRNCPEGSAAVAEAEPWALLAP